VCVCVCVCVLALLLISSNYNFWWSTFFFKMKQDALGHLDNLLDNLDVERIGKVSFDSWTVFTISRMLTTQERLLHPVFCLLDGDGDGQVTPADVRLLLHCPERTDLLASLFEALSADSGTELSAQDFAELPLDAGCSIDFNTFLRLWYANAGWKGKLIQVEEASSPKATQSQPTVDVNVSRASQTLASRDPHANVPHSSPIAAPTLAKVAILNDGDVFGKPIVDRSSDDQKPRPPDSKDVNFHLWPGTDDDIDDECT
jgi:hypothetical protein